MTFPVPSEPKFSRVIHVGERVQYQPQMPSNFDPGIIVIGCGGIIKHHLEAYRDAGWTVQALVDVRRGAAEQMASKFYPAAKIFTDYQEAFRHCDGAVVDIATHPEVRIEIIRAALSAGRHVLSQKPFVLDLDVGQELVEFADARGLKLAVNQNGRWAPHFGYMRNAIAAGMIGQTFAARMSVDWDHTWVAGTAFEHVKHLVLYDYAIHWFDMIRCLLPESRATKVFASTGRAPGQQIMPNLLGQVLIDFDNAQASMTFDAMVRHAPEDRTYVAGTKGVVQSIGSGHQDQKVRVTTDDGPYEPELSGKWFSDGFRGTMGELLSSIAAKRACTIDGRDNLHSLALCFAAIKSAETGMPYMPGSVRRLPG